MFQAFLFILAATCAQALLAAPPAIGVATSRGSFSIDRHSISGNATLFEGNLIETGTDASQIQLTLGARLWLSPASRGRVYSDHLVLEQGSGKLIAGAKYRIDATDLRIAPTAENTSAGVALVRPGVVQVATAKGAVQVRKGSDVILADVPTGDALEFEHIKPTFQLASAAQAVQVAALLSIVVLEGEGAINNIRARTGREAIVQVTDSNRRPVSEALVRFRTPETGPGGTFPDGSHVFQTTTDAQGKAVMRGLTPNETEGQFQVQVEAEDRERRRKGALVFFMINSLTGTALPYSRTTPQTTTTPTTTYPQTTTTQTTPPLHPGVHPEETPPVHPTEVDEDHKKHRRRVIAGIIIGGVGATSLGVAVGHGGGHDQPLSPGAP